MRVASIAASGLRAASTQLEASAHNVANVSTDGFRPVRTVTTAQREGGVSARIAPAEDPALAALGRVEGGSGTDLAEETVQRMLAQRAFLANLAVLRTVDEMAEELGKKRG